MHHDRPTPAQNSRRTTRPVRRAALAAAAVLVTAAGVGAASPATAAPHAKKATVKVIKLAGVPGTTTAGSSLKVTTTVRNVSKKKSTKKTVVVHLSTDSKLDGKDTRLASAKTGKLKPRKSTRVKASATLPTALTPGTYYVLACVGSSCKAAKTVIPAGAPAAPAQGTLTGTITLGETSPREGWTKVDRSAQLNIAMSWTGPFATNNDFQNTASTYNFASKLTKEPAPDTCTTYTEAVGTGAGPLAVTGNPYTDQLAGSIKFDDLSTLNLHGFLPFTTKETVKKDGDETCEHSTTSTSRAGQDIYDIDLTQLSRTATDITYQVSAIRGAYGAGSDWDTASGTLTLHLG
jgi:hypothetical protein